MVRAVLKQSNFSLSVNCYQGSVQGFYRSKPISNTQNILAW